jgi:hypothetical protein
VSQGPIKRFSQFFFTLITKKKTLLLEETFGNFAMRLKSFHQMSKVDELVIVV